MPNHPPYPAEIPPQSLPGELGLLLFRVVANVGAVSSLGESWLKVAKRGADLSQVATRFKLRLLTDDRILPGLAHDDAERVADVVASLLKRRLAGDEPLYAEWTAGCDAAKDVAIALAKPALLTCRVSYAAVRAASAAVWAATQNEMAAAFAAEEAAEGRRELRDGKWVDGTRRAWLRMAEQLVTLLAEAPVPAEAA